MGSQDNRETKYTVESISNTISGDGRKFASELKNYLRKFSTQVEEIVKDVVTDIGEGSAEQVDELTLLEVHVTGKTGAPQNNIQVDFSNVNVANYKQAQIWMKVGSADFTQIGITNGLRYVVEDVKADTTYTIKVISANKNGGTASFDEAPQKSITIQGSVLIPDAPHQFYLTWDSDGALWEWLYEDNGYVDFFELRLDTNAGSYDEYLLDRTRNTYSRVAPPARSGTGYLFVRNIFGTYSQPAIHAFNKQLAAKPNLPVIEATLDGVVITMDPLPSGYQGWKLVINGEEFKVYNRQFTYYQFSGEVTVKYCFFDIIGSGEWSDEVTEKIKTTIDKDDLPEISYDEFDQSIKDAIDAANGQAGINEQIKAEVAGVKQDIENATAELDKSIDEVQADVDGIVADLNKNAVDSPFTSIKQNNERITALAATVKEVDGKTQTNAAQIELTNQSISSLVLQVQEVDGKTQTNASLINQTADEIRALVSEEVETLDGKISTNASSIKQNTDSITAAVTKIDTVESNVKQNTASIEITNQSINSVVSSLNGTAEDSGYKALTGLASSIVQTDKSITSVVAELNKAPENCSYSAITQLKGGIDLCVKDKDLNGEEIVTRINLSDGVVSIDGKWVHVTGDTVFDNNVIVGGYIATEAITTNHIKANAVTTAKIDTNAITADKIAADSITTEKITDKSVTSVKIEDGAITATKIVDGAVSSTKIEGGAITTEHIKAGSIVGEHISAGAVTSKSIAAGAVTAQAIAAGAINAETLGVTELSAITAKIGELKTSDTGARMVIKDNLIEIYDDNNVLRVRMGVWDEDATTT